MHIMDFYGLWRFNSLSSIRLFHEAVSIADIMERQMRYGSVMNARAVVPFDVAFWTSPRWMEEHRRYFLE
jgi:hypothetical protein